MAYLLQNCSNNLNQYAKRANEDGSIYAADIQDLQKRLDELIILSKRILQKLGDLYPVQFYLSGWYKKIPGFLPVCAGGAAAQRYYLSGAPSVRDRDQALPGTAEACTLPAQREQPRPAVLCN